MPYKEAAYLLIRTDLNAFRVVQSVKSSPLVRWAKVVYGPYQITAYVESDSEKELVTFIEDLRSRRFIVELDARRCKQLPEDKHFAIKDTPPQSAVLLINVNYKEEKERVVTLNLRQLSGVILARAMWGPADIIAIVGTESHESLRNLICDDIKTMKGVMNNTTLYGYPPTVE
jgi:hypothetical protein